MKPASPVVLGTGDGVSRLALPLGSPAEFPRVVMSGSVIGVGTSGCMEGMGGLTGMGVRRGMADIADMGCMPTDRLGIEPIPTRRECTEANKGEDSVDKILNIKLYQFGQ